MQPDQKFAGIASPLFFNNQANVPNSLALHLVFGVGVRLLEVFVISKISVCTMATVVKLERQKKHWCVMHVLYCMIGTTTQLLFLQLVNW